MNVTRVKRDSLHYDWFRCGACGGNYQEETEADICCRGEEWEKKYL